MPTNLLPIPGNISFHAQHSPVGAFASFTCGHFGSRGGIGAQIGRPANQDLFIGIKEGTRSEEGVLKCLPFFGSSQSGGAGAADFVVDQAGPAEQQATPHVVPCSEKQIRRHYGWATDRWNTDDFSFTVYTPFGEIPDPALAGFQELRNALLPAVVAELEIDNRRGTRTKTGFFCINFNEPGWRPLESTRASARGFTLRRQFGILGQVVSAAPPRDADGPALFCRWAPEEGLREPVPHRLGSCPGLALEVPAGERRILRIAIGWYIEGVVTSGLEGRYLYTKYFAGLEDVLDAALAKGDPAPAATRLDEQLTSSGLSPDQQFLIAHATRSYYGSTQLLEIGGQPFWVVNEGEYCMMNTLDLCVDQMFWELDQNPWVVRNLLDNFVRHYSYVDTLKDKNGGVVPGGLSFTHDMGAHNIFSPPSHSSYELPGLNAVCFSYMTAEELCNWVLMATTYVVKTGDMNWARQNSHVLLACLQSLCNRSSDSGIPEFDSSRCGEGAEITTYDSLDHSLAQARHNLYMAVKFWASCVGLSLLFHRLGPPWQEHAGHATRRAEWTVQTLLRQVGPDGVLPAVLDPSSSGFHSRILPACESLLYPLQWGINTAAESPELYRLLKQHTLALLSDPLRRNLFSDGGIKLSSTSNNSWMSKIAIFQQVATRVFHFDLDPCISAVFAAADRAHVSWQINGSGYWACSDQFVDGVAKGSRWYPRAITTTLWMASATLAEEQATPVPVASKRRASA